MSAPVLFVCLGNRVRSPMAHGCLRHKLREAGLSEALVASAGTHAWPGDEPPEPEAVFEMARRGVDISDLRSRLLTESDLRAARLVLAMDWDSRALIEAAFPDQDAGRLRGLAEFMQRHDEPVMPDPAAVGFDALIVRLDDACDGVLRFLQQNPSVSSAR